jgi:hypothetical protein
MTVSALSAGAEVEVEAAFSGGEDYRTWYFPLEDPSAAATTTSAYVRDTRAGWLPERVYLDTNQEGRRVTVSVLFDALGSVALLSGAVTASGQFALLKRRRAASRVRQVISAPAGYLVRLGLLIAEWGALVLTRALAAVSVMLALIAWELTVQVTAQVRRARHGRASRAS